MKRVLLSVIAALTVAIAPLGSQAVAGGLQPYVLASDSAGSVAAKAGDVKKALSGAGFEVVGDYSPYKGAQVVIATNDAIKANAAKSKHGGFGAVVRVGITDVGGKIQVSYTNPAYWANAFRLKGDNAAAGAALAKALGSKSGFGYAKGFSADDLKEYHYMMMMPYFDDEEELGSFGSQAAAVKAVAANLKAGKGGNKLVYRVDLPGGKATVFGVNITQGAGADASIMKIVDTGKLRQTASLPYEVLVDGGKVITLHGKFRIAIGFPELGMGTFMKISDAPDAIVKSLEAIAK
jgi:hypothetical protein